MASWLPHKILNRETHRGHRPAQFHHATGGDGQRLELSNCFQQSQVIRRIHLHHRRINQTCVREQTHFGRTLDDVIIGNQTTIVRDKKARAGAVINPEMLNQVLTKAKIICIEQRLGLE